jgi:hypothetical protein
MVWHGKGGKIHGEALQAYFSGGVGRKIQVIRSEVLQAYVSGE